MRWLMWTSIRDGPVKANASASIDGAQREGPFEVGLGLAPVTREARSVQQGTQYENRERIATLEAQRRTLQEQLAETREDVRSIQRDVREIKTTLTSHRGFVAGVVVTVSVIWTMGLGIWQFIKHKIGT